MTLRPPCDGTEGETMQGFFFFEGETMQGRLSSADGFGEHSLPDEAGTTSVHVRLPPAVPFNGGNSLRGCLHLCLYEEDPLREDHGSGGRGDNGCRKR